MSEGQDGDNSGTLFSLELLVDYVRLGHHVSDELAVGVRLLDFPTLLIYQPQVTRGDDNHTGGHDREKQGEYTFNRGKSCFFLMNLNSLHTHLSNTPLYAMVLDVKEEIPRLVGSSLISLAKVMDRVMQDVAAHGVSTPSSHGERGLFDLCSLTGEKIGSMSLSYKLLSLGSSLLPRIAGGKSLQGTRGDGGQESLKEKNPSSGSPAHSPTLHMSGIITNTESKGAVNAKSLIGDDKQGVSDVSFPANDRRGAQIPQTPQESGNCFEENVFCPPHLYYCNSAEEEITYQGSVYKQQILDSEAFTYETSGSEDELTENKIDAPSYPVSDHRVKYDPKTPGVQEISGVGSNMLGEAVRQLPLLNALLVELSQLNGQNPPQPLSIHPNLAWIYRPASTEPSAGHRDTPRKTLEETKQRSSPHLQYLHSPRNCSTPIVSQTSAKKPVKQEKALPESKSSNKSTRKKLVYGTTKAFNLRMKQIPPLKAKHRECMELIKNEKQTNSAKGRTKPKNKNMETSQKKSALNQRTSLTENVETIIQSIKLNAELQETVTLKRSDQHRKVHEDNDGDSLGISEPCPPSERRDLIHIPCVDSDSAAKNKAKSESEQSQYDRYRKNVKSAGSSRHSSPKSSSSYSSREGNEEVEYADDFNSLESSTSDESDGHLSTSLRSIYFRKQVAESSRLERSSDAESLVSSRSQRCESSENNSPVQGLTEDSLPSIEPHETEELEDELGSLDFRKEYRHISELVINKLPGYTM